MEYKCGECGYEYKYYETATSIENICPNCRSNNVEPFKKSIPIKLTPVKTLDEWFANLPLYNKAKIYLNCNKPLYISSWDNLTEQEKEIMKKNT